MKKKLLLTLSVVMIGLVFIGNYSFAKDLDSNFSIVSNVQEKSIVRENEDYRYGYGHWHGGYGCPGFGYENREHMIEIMKKSGYDNMVKWMEEGNYEAIDKYMRSLTIEEYNEMMENIHNNRIEYFEKEGITRRGYPHHGMGMMRGSRAGHHGMGRMRRMF